ncbi:MAG: zinc ribbon domain-containing protein [Planctomycetaceae bacterium]|nr:zinc ribbon domain-containing protein [Planctomycetaceae bacterium]
MTRFCSQCGHPLAPQDKFCGSCGSRISSPGETAPSSPLKTSGKASLHKDPGSTGARRRITRLSDSGTEPEVSTVGEHRTRKQTKAAPHGIKMPNARSPVHRKFFGWGGCAAVLGGLILAGVLVGLAVVYQFDSENRPQTNDSQAPHEDPWPAPPMPARIVEHPSGARVEAPAGTFPESAVIKITVRDEAPSAEPFERVGSAYSIDGISLLTGQQPAFVDLPSGAAGERAVVLFRSLGTWIRIPSESIQLADGSAGRRMQLHGVPFPWVLSVAVAPESASVADLAEGTSRTARLARLEQLRITDLPKFFRELEHFDKSELEQGNLSESFSLLSSAVADEPATSINSPLEYGKDHWNKARIAMLRAYGLIHNPKASDQVARRSSSIKLYREGLNHLWEARRAVFAMTEEEAATAVDDESNSQNLTVVYGGTLPLAHMVEAYCGTLAPWGLQLTRHLVAGDDVGARGFDVRCVPFFGNLLFVDVTLPGGEKPVPFLNAAGQPSAKAYVELERYQRELVQELWLIPEKAVHFDVVRLYSPAINEWNRHEILSNLKTAKSCVSAFFAVALLAEGAALGPAVWAIYEVAAPFIEYVLVDPEIKEIAHKGGPSQLTLISLYDGAKVIAQLTLAPGASPAGGLTDMVLNFLIDHKEMDRIEKLRAEVRAAANNVVGYKDWDWGKNFPVPPVVLKSTVYGPTKDRPEYEDRWGSYKMGGEGQLTMTLNYAALGADGANLAECFRKKHDEISYNLDDQMHAATPYGIHWTPFGQKTWMRQLFDQGPDLQVVHWRVEKEQLERWAQAAGLSMEKWMEGVTVDVCYGTEWDESRRLSPPDKQTLKKLLRPDEEEQTTTFGFAIQSKPTRGRSQVLLQSDTAGPWRDYAAYSMRDYPMAAKRYFVRVRYGETELLAFPVGFGERFLENPTAWHNLSDTKQNVEVATVHPARDGRPDIMDYLLFANELPQGLEEKSRDNLSIIGGPYPLDLAEQIILTSGYDLKLPPVDYDLDPRLPPMNGSIEEWKARFSDEEWEKDESGYPIARKKKTSELPRAKVTVRIGRSGKTGPISDAMIKAGIKIITRNEELQSAGNGVLVSQEGAASHAIVFRKDDLLIGLFGEDNSELTRSYIDQLKPRFEAHAARVASKAKVSP